MPGDSVGDRQKPSVWIVVPAFNEGPVVGEVIAELVQHFDNVVLVDDGSSDRTGDVAFAAGATIVRHHLNLGQGAALQTGIDFALGEGADYVGTFDADGQHRPEDLAAMLTLQRTAGADVVLGSRFLGKAPGIGRRRRFMLRLGTRIQRWMTGLALTDTHTGLRLFTRAAARQIRIRQNRMAHASELVAQIADLGLKIIEAPCTVRYTARSVAKGQRLTGAFQIVLDLTVRSLYR